jgi:4-hydroxy-tetrahydrodipicolinate reductase
MMDSLRVLVIGAAGRMGREVVRAVSAQQDMDLVGTVDRGRVGEDAGEVAGLEDLSVPISDSLSQTIAQASPDVAVDFTIPDSVMDNARATVKAKVATVVGATGLTDQNLDELAALCKEHQTPCLVAPNFAIGAVLMMQFAAEAAKHFDSAEIIELHHADKRDAPSGTALRTAGLIADSLCRAGISPQADARRSDEEHPSRGLAHRGIPIHSIRLPGLVAHQEVILGGLGQTLTVRHDSTSRQSFMPGVLLAIRKVRSLRGLVVGLEKIL